MLKKLKLTGIILVNVLASVYVVNYLIMNWDRFAAGLSLIW